MPLRAYDWTSAIRNLNENTTARWHANGVDVRDPDGSYAVQRINQGTFIPRITPSFRFSRADRLFAIGSCFARGVEHYLKLKDFQMLSAAEEFDRFELSVAPGEGSRLGFINKYNTHAIRYALQWALDPERPFPGDALLQVDDETWFDPHTTPVLKFGSREQALEQRRIMNDVYSRIRTCRVVFLTLGLVESWFDTTTGLYLNMAPTMARDKRRFELHVTDYEQNLANLEEIHRLLTTYGHPDLRIVVTVSPVPLGATFTEKDIVVANTYSKCLLRTVAEAWVSRHSNIDYFPSYEIVTLSDRAQTWREDGRHVTWNLTSTIAKVFMQHYWSGV